MADREVFLVDPPPSSEQDLSPTRQETFVQLLTEEQNRLFGYLVTLLGDVNNADNVLQQTNLVLWRRADDFELGTSFGAWAKRVAYFQTLAFLRDHKRDGLVFDEETVARIALSFEAKDEDDDDSRRVALRHCLSQLPERQMRILRQRYWSEDSIRSIAQTERKSESSIKMALMRVRRALLACIQDQVGPQGNWRAEA